MGKTRVDFGTPIVVAVMSFCAEDFAGGGQVITRGRRLRADDDVVQAHPEYFAQDGLSDAEYLQRFFALGGMSG